MLKKILVTTDGSDVSQKAIKEAVDFAATNGSTIVGLAVAELFPTAVMPEIGAGYDLKGIEAQIQRQAEDHVKFIADCAKAAGAAYEVHIVKAEYPYEAILKFATQSGCDSILMASHGRKGLDKLILGSQTQKVLTYSKLPVLVFK